MFFVLSYWNVNKNKSTDKSAPKTVYVIKLKETENCTLYLVKFQLEKKQLNLI